MTFHAELLMKPQDMDRLIDIHTRAGMADDPACPLPDGRTRGEAMARGTSTGDEFMTESTLSWVGCASRGVPVPGFPLSAVAAAIALIADRGKAVFARALAALDESKREEGARIIRRYRHRQPFDVPNLPEK